MRRRVDRKIIAEMLEKTAREAAPLYASGPCDYKGRRVTPEGVLGTARSSHCVEVVSAVAANARGAKTLDVGIAYGIYDIVLKRLFGFEIHGVEHPHNISAYAKFPIQNGIPVHPCDLHFDDLPFEKETFDTVIASEVVEHLHIPPRILFSKIFPVLKPAGRVVVTTPNFLSLRNVHVLLRGLNPAAPFPEKAGEGGLDPRVHPREYTPKEIRKSLTDAGFGVARMYTVVESLPPEAPFHSRIMTALMKRVPGHGEKIIAIAEKERCPARRIRPTP